MCIRESIQVKTTTSIEQEKEEPASGLLVGAKAVVDEATVANVGVVFMGDPINDRKINESRYEIIFSQSLRKSNDLF